jgi:hypothetical protein
MGRHSRHLWSFGRHHLGNRLPIATGLGDIMKPGWKTSECWQAVLAQGLAFCTLLGIVNTTDAHSLEETIGKCITAIFALCANGYIVIHYISVRFHLKMDDSINKPPSSFNFPSPGVKSILWIGLLGGLFFMGAEAQAQSIFPWRSGIQQQLKNHDNQINNLQNRPQQAPQQQAPQIIVIPPAQPPLQTLPIQGQPQQSFPIQGQPRQDFPIQGQPRQDFPIQGQPQQQLPIQGQPQQSFPIQGPIQQKLPITPMPPAISGGGPQSYSINRALAQPIE